MSNFPKLCPYDAKLIKQAVTLEYHHGVRGIFNKVLWMLQSGVRYQAIADLLNYNFQEVLDNQNSDTSVTQENK